MILANYRFSSAWKLAMISNEEIGFAGAPYRGFTYFAAESSYAAKPPVGRGYNGLVRRIHRRKRHE